MIQVLFYFTLLAFILGHIARVSIGNGVAVTLLDISVFLLVSYWIISKILKKDQVKGKLLQPILLFIGVCLFSLLINSSFLNLHELAVASLYLTRWIFYAGVYFVVRDMPKDFKKKIPILLLGVGVVHIIVGYLQYFFYPDLSQLYHLGWDEHLYRLFGSFLDPNYQGTMYVLLAILVLINLQKKLQLRNKYAILGLSLLLISILIAIVLTYSRSALVMLVVIVICYTILEGYKKIALAIVGSIIVFVVLFSNIYIEGLNPLRAASTSARLSSMSEAIQIIERNVIFGVGFNAYRYAQNRYGFRTSDFWMKSNADAGTDNSFLFVFATTGIVGILTYLFLVKNILQNTYPKKEKGTIKTVAFISVVGILVNSLFINSLFYTFLLYWLWTLIGLTENT